MAKITLTYYTMTVFETLDKKHSYPVVIGDIVDKYGNDFSNIAKKYFYNCALSYQNDTKKENLFRAELFNLNNHYYDGLFYFKSITGIVKSGNYGIEGELVDSANTAMRRPINSTEAPVLPFGFGIFYNPERDSAILVLQSVGRNGITAQMKTRLDNMVAEVNPNYTVQIINVAPTRMIMQLFNDDKVKSIKYEVYAPNNTIAVEDRLGQTTTLTTSSKTTIIKRPVINNVEFWIKLFTNRTKLSTLTGLANGEEELENISVEFNNKTLNYNAYTNTKVSEDISEHFKDEPNVVPERLFNIMIENVLPYLTEAQIIERLPVDNVNIDKRLEYTFYNELNEETKEEKVIERDFAVIV
jgi:hypothetical protein